MKAWVVEAFEDPFVMHVRDVPRPEPAPGEVLIRVAAAGLNFGETLVLNGTYQKLPALPYIPVSEYAGVVEACGDGVEGIVPGDRVVAFSVPLEGGGLAEFASIPVQWVFPLASHLSLVQGAAYPMNFWTAWNALTRRGDLRRGETLVVHGGTGGIGVAAIAIGAALGARVIATGRGADRLALLHEIGVEAVIDLAQENLRDRLKELTGGRGADVFVDPVGGEVFEASMRAIAPGGRILVLGFTSGVPAAARTNVMLVKMVSVIGVEARLAIEKTDGQGMEDYRAMHRWIAQTGLVPQVGRTCSFGEVPDAYADILGRRHIGKTVAIMDPDLCR